MILFPWTLHKAGGLTKTVQNEAEKADALRDGWQIVPPDQQPKAEAGESVADPVDVPEPKVKAKKAK